MTGGVGPLATNQKSTPPVAKSACPSPHFPEDPGTSTRHIRFSTPPSSLCESSPELTMPATASRRVRTRPESPSALAVLAAVCSSPNVRWDGVKHQYGEGHGKSIWCDDLRMARGPPRQTHIVHPLSPSSHLVYGERSFPFQATIKTDMDSYGHEDLQKMLVDEEMRFSSVEDEEDEGILPSKVPRHQDYFSEVPSSPPTLVFSSPYNGTSYDVSSSDERSSTLPLSSPGPPNLPETSSPTSTPMHDDAIDKVPQDPLSTEAVKVEHPTGLFISNLGEGNDLVISPAEQLQLKQSDSEAPTTDREFIRTPSFSPLQAPDPLPGPCVDLSLVSPLSSLISSPLSELMEEEPLSPDATRFSIISDAVSARSTSPDTDIDSDYIRKPKAGGRRASAANVFGTTARRMSGLSSSKHWRRSDTAPPETTPCKRPRQASPSSPIPRPLQLRRLSSSPSPSPRSNDPIASSAMLTENRRVGKKHKQKIGTKGTSTSSKVKRPSDPSQPDSVASHQSIKRSRGKSSNRDDGGSETNGAISDLHALPPAELTALPVTGFLVETLALSRASAITAPELLRAVLKSQPHLMEERTEKLWLELVRCILVKVRMFGRIERRGTDAADRPLEDQWFYIPENDEEDGRAELLRGLMPKKRDVTKRPKQYYFEPVQKVSRWDPEDD